MHSRNYYLLWSFSASVISLFIIYNEFNALTHAASKGSIIFHIEKYNFVLVGTPAILAHIALLFFGVLALISAFDAYIKYRHYNTHYNEAQRKR